MKKIAFIIAIPLALLAIALLILFFLRNAISNSMNNHERIDREEENAIISLNPADGIVLLEDGLLAVRYDGDYGFDALLAQGGVSSDRAWFIGS